MKKVLICLYLIVSAFCYGKDIEWKLTRDSKAYDGYYKYVTEFKADQIVDARSTSVSGKNGEMEYDYGARIYDEETRLTVDAEAVIPNGTQAVLDESILTPAVNRKGKTWFNAHSIPIIQSKNRDTARQFEKKTLGIEDRAGEGYWYDNPYMGETMDLFQVVITMCGNATLTDFYILDIIECDTHYELTVLCTEWTNPDSTIPIEDQPVEGEETVLLLYPDGEYMDIYVQNTNNHLWSFVQVDEEYQKQFWTLIRQAWYPDNIFDLTNVTFPRRADKNHTVGNSCIVAENLRLRKEESTSSVTLQTMQTGTSAKILQLGKKQTIDGITANWVQVELDDGTRGWCFGGYLVEK